MNFFEFNGTRSSDLGLVISQTPDYQAPDKLGDAVTIPGRNGTLHMSTGAYGNVTKKYECWFEGGPTEAHAIKSWLLGASGYCKLADNYDPEHYRMARFSGPQDISNILGKIGELTIEFDCRPEMFEAAGDIPVIYTESGSLYNPWPFPARPIIRVYSTGTLTVNGYQCIINSVDGYVDLDSETRQASKGTANCNGNVSIPEFPALSGGKNVIVLDGISRVDIIPRWWTV